MNAAVGILTTRGGMTSHAAVVARGHGQDLRRGRRRRSPSTSTRATSGPERLSARRGTGSRSTGRPERSILGKIATRPSEILQVAGREEPRTPTRRRSTGRFERILSWADKRRRLGCGPMPTRRRTPRVAVVFGAEGIGLCRTEHMFFEERPHPGGARDDPGRATEAGASTPSPRSCRCSARTSSASSRRWTALPVTIRLLDPPLHEFLPERGREQSQDAGRAQGVAARSCGSASRAAARVEPDARPPRLPARHHLSGDLRDAGPRRSSRPRPRSCAKGSAGPARDHDPARRNGAGVHRPAQGPRRRGGPEVAKEPGRHVPYMVGTMIEIPRAALVADADRRATPSSSPSAPTTSRR